MRRMKFMVAVALFAAMAAGCVSAVPEPAKVLSGDGLTGRVVDASTGQPLPGAMVWIRWSTFSPGHSHAETCQHMDLAFTDADGWYRTPPWRVENPPFAYGSLFRFSEVYLRGYGRRSYERNVPGTPDLRMPVWTGTDNERLDLLTALRMRSSCIGGADPAAEPLAAQIQKALLSEFVQIPGSREQKAAGYPVISVWENTIRRLEGDERK